MVLLSFELSLKDFFSFLCQLCTIVFYLQVILHFLLSLCVCVFALLHFSIVCHKLFGINLKERKLNIIFFLQFISSMPLIILAICMMSPLSLLFHKEGKSKYSNHLVYVMCLV